MCSTQGTSKGRKEREGERKEWMADLRSDTDVFMFTGFKSDRLGENTSMAIWAIEGQGIGTRPGCSESW